MQDVIGLTVYNPSSLTDDDFLRGFVARQDLAHDMAERLVDVAEGRLLRHFLLHGQRGMGKTSMLRRLALAAKSDTRLSTTLIPLSFREEQYNVHSSQVFWTNCLEALADWFEQVGEYVKAGKLDKDILSLNSKNDDAQKLFNEWISREGRRPLLLLDNIDLIFSGLKREAGHLEIFTPRVGGVIIVGGSSTSIDAICDSDGELKDSFNIVNLNRLTKAELMACLRTLALARGPEGEKVLQALATESARIKTMHDLTGGNPRTLTMLYMLLATAIEGDVFRDLGVLLDQATVLYKARVEDLPLQSRVVLDAVALAWDPTLASAVAVATGLDVTVVSSQLDRLQKEGIIEKVSVSKTSKAAFQIIERFFNVWYLMRHGARRQKSRLRWLTVFLKSFYSHDQLVERAKSLADGSNHLGDSFGVELGQQYLALSDAIDDEGWRSILKTQAREEFRRLAESLGLSLNEIVDPSDVPLPVNAIEWVRNGNLLRGHLKRPKDAERAFLHAIELEKNNFPAWFNLGAVQLGDLANPLDAIKSFRKTLALNPKHLPSQYLLADALAIVGRIEEAKAAYRRCLSLNPKFYLAALAIGDINIDEGDFLGAAKQFNLAGKIAPESDIDTLHGTGYFLAYIIEDFEKSLSIYQRLLRIDPSDILALSNAAIVTFFAYSSRTDMALDKSLLIHHSAGGQALMCALEAASQKNVTLALSFVPEIFSVDAEKIFEEYKGFIFLLFREAHRQGWGNILQRILDDTGDGEKIWPLLVGYDAYMNGASRLQDVNPEVRFAATEILQLLLAPETYKRNLGG